MVYFKVKVGGGTNTIRYRKFNHSKGDENLMPLFSQHTKASTLGFVSPLKSHEEGSDPCLRINKLVLNSKYSKVNSKSLVLLPEEGCYQMQHW